MDIFIKETLYVLDYDNNIVDMIFTSDDHRTPGYAYNINIEESNMGYSNLTFTMPTKIMPMANDFGEVENSQELIPNPKLAKLTPLVKLRYVRQLFYTGYSLTYIENDNIVKEYKKGDLLEEYIMDYIVQPLDKKRSGLEISLNFNAIDYPRFNLSKKKFGLTINDQTVTRDDWTMYEEEPMSVAGTVKYIKWDDSLSERYSETGRRIVTEWDPSNAGGYPMNEKEIANLLGTPDFATVWEYGLSSTVYWWPITKTARHNGIIYREGDYLTLQIYPKFETGDLSEDEIRHTLDFYGYEWLYLDKGDSYLTPNGPYNYLNWILENTNWSIKSTNDRCKGVYIVNQGEEVTTKPAAKEFDYILVLTANNKDPKYLGTYTYTNGQTKEPLTEADEGKWFICKTIDAKTGELLSIAVNVWDGKKWYTEYKDKQYITSAIFVYSAEYDVWTDVTKYYWTHNIDKKTGVLYDIDIVETEVAKPSQASGDLFETTELIASLSASDSNCYNAITELCKTFQLYPSFDCINRTVSLHILSGKENGLSYRLGETLENTAVKEDGEKVITKLYSFGGKDTNGEEDINLGDAERSYRDYGIDPDDREPWDPNAPEYIQMRSPYGTNYVYNFKWMYDNGWMSKDDILGIYELNQKIQDLNKSFLEPYTKDFLKTNDEYVNAGVVYSTNQDEYLSVITSMMNTYYREPGVTTDKFTAFPLPPGDCYSKPEEPHRYYLDVHHCYNCGATAKSFENNECPNCGAITQQKTIHINTWEEEFYSALSTTSDKLDPSSKGHFQQVYEQLGENSNAYIYIGTIFTEEPLTDYDTNEKAFKIQGKTVYDKSSHLYNWNDCVIKWMKFYGLSLDSEVEVNKLQERVEKLEQAYKVYEYQKNDLENQVQDTYGNFIIEGKFSDPEIVYPAVLLNKTLEASDKYATPKVTYSLNVIDTSGLVEFRNPKSEIYNDFIHKLHSIGQVVPRAGDYVSVYDEPMGMYGVPGMITTIKRVLDNPQSNSITVDTSYTDDEELVGNIITATNTVLNNTDIYARTAIIKGDGTIDSAAISRTLENNNGNNISFVGVNGSTVLDSKGLLVTSPGDSTRKMKYSGTGVFGTVNNGVTYEPLLTPEGINANYISSGSIDTHKIQIMSGLQSKVVLDSQGLSIKDKPNESYTIPDGKYKTVDGIEDKFLDWSGSNLKAFIGVDYHNEAQLYLSGQMQIEGGSTIAGWNVLDHKLSSIGENGNYVGISSDGEYAFWAGHSDPKLANFSVKHDGTFWAKALTDGDALTLGAANDKAASLIKQMAESISLSVTNGETSAGITISIKDSDGNTTTKAGTIEMTGLVSFTNLSTSGSTTINGDNITTGKILAKYIDAENLVVKQAATISGKLNADQIEGGSITASTINLKNGTFKVTTAGYVTASSGKIGGWELSSSKLSATNTGGSCTLDPSTGSLAFYTNVANPEYFKFDGSLTAYTLGIDLTAKSSIGIYAGSGSNALSGNVVISSTKSSSYYVKMNHVYACSDTSAQKYWLSFANAASASPARIRSNGSNLCLYAASGSAIYAGGDTDDYKIKTAGATPSSLNVKTNLVSLKDEYDVLYEEMKEVQAYNFDYKYGNVNGDLTSDYGFIIDEIENTQHLSHYFKNHEATRVIDENNALQHINSDDISQENMEHIDIKVWDTDSYIKGLFVMIKTLQHKIDKLEEQIKKEKTN